MFVNSLDKKPIVKRSDEVELRDLTSSMFDLDTKNYAKYNVYRVPKEFAMRPDLISGSVYGNSVYAEIILKFNSISNPFSIQEGDLILVPDLDSAQSIINTTQQGSDTDGAKAIRNTYKYIDPTKAPKANNEFTNRQIVSGAKEGALPPNMAEEGEEQITYRNGRVYFSSSVETCFQNGQTQSEFLTNVIRSKVK